MELVIFHVCNCIIFPVLIFPVLIFPLLYCEQGNTAVTRLTNVHVCEVRVRMIFNHDVSSYMGRIEPPTVCMHQI